MVDDANHRLIQERAYQIWLREGRPHGRDQDHWRQAEQEVAKQYHASDARPDTSARPKPDSQTTSPTAHGADSQPRPDGQMSHVDSPSGATPAGSAGTGEAPKKRASRAKLKEDPGAATKGKPSKKQAGDGAIREPPRK
jgi:hypothetical protein